MAATGIRIGAPWQSSTVVCKLSKEIQIRLINFKDRREGRKQNCKLSKEIQSRLNRSDVLNLQNSHRLLQYYVGFTTHLDWCEERKQPHGVEQPGDFLRETDHHLYLLLDCAGLPKRTSLSSPVLAWAIRRGWTAQKSCNKWYCYPFDRRSEVLGAFPFLTQLNTPHGCLGRQMPLSFYILDEVSRFATRYIDENIMRLVMYRFGLALWLEILWK